MFVDTAPVMEKPLGEAAGIGWQGKHTNLVSREHGNWLFLGAIYTTLPFAPDAPHEERCGSCRACQDACPTDAFPEPFRLDARRCISYLTIEHKGPIPEEFRAAIGNRIYGCDDCLAVCPWNKFAETAARHRAFLPRAELAAPRLAELLALDDAGFRRLFSGSPIKRIGRDRFVRNCLIAAGNSGNAELDGAGARVLAIPTRSGTRPGRPGTIRSAPRAAHRARERQGGVDRAEEQPVAVLAIDGARCACPASRCPAASASGFSITGAVSTNASTRIVPELLRLGDHPPRQRLQRLLDRGRDRRRLARRPKSAPARGRLRARTDSCTRGIAHAERDHALRLGPHRLRTLAHVGALVHPFHFAVQGRRRAIRGAARRAADRRRPARSRPRRSRASWPARPVAPSDRRALWLRPQSALLLSTRAG